MLIHFVAACKAARAETAAGQTTIAALLGLNQSSVARFEAGAGWPRNPDSYAEAYAVAGHTTPAAIWRDALARLEADGATDLPAEMVAVEQALTAAATAKRKGRAAKRAS